MRKLNLTPYKVDTQDYDVKTVMASILFHPDLRVSARNLMVADRLAQKIESGNGSVLLEESEYERLKTAVETITGWGRGDLEFVQRVLDAPEIDVKEA